jgi:4-hydroxybenzoate polyprenyltransferase
MDDRPDTPNASNETSVERARARGQRAFRSMLGVFAVGFAALAGVAFIVTGEAAAVLLVVFAFLGIALFGWLGQRWLLRNINER